MINQQLIERYCLLLLSIEIMSVGIVFIQHADLGITPIFAFAQILSLYFKSGFLYNIIFQLFLIFIQIIVLKGKFKRFQIFQIMIWFILKAFIEFNNIIFLGNFFPKHYLFKILFLLIGCFLTGFGISIQLFIKTLYTPVEGLLFTIYNKFNYNLCYTKIILDCILIFISISFSYLLLGNIYEIKEGTIISALLVGYFLGICNKKVGIIVIDFLYRNLQEKKGEEEFNNDLFVNDDLYNIKEDFVNSLTMWD